MARSYYVIKNNSTGFCLSGDWTGNVKTITCESEPGTSQPRYGQQWYPAQGTGNDPDQTHLLKNRRTILCLSMDYTQRPPNTGAVTAVACDSSSGNQWLTPHTVNGRLEAFYGGRLFDESGSTRVRLYNGTVNPVAASLWKATCLTSGGCAADLWGPPVWFPAAVRDGSGEIAR